jgi:hypothetical protein
MLSLFLELCENLSSNIRLSWVLIGSDDFSPAVCKINFALSGLIIYTSFLCKQHLAAAYLHDEGH